jgi:ERCC4-type nuclease
MSALTISATKPKGKPAKMLAEMGIRIVPIDEDEGNVDRYILSKRLAVERRTGGAFLKGIMDKTLFTSAIYLREHFHLPVLIIEGQVNYEYSAFDPQAVRGALSSMLLQYGLNVLATPNVEETVALVAMMARQEQMGIPEISLIPNRKATDLADMQRRVIEMLPGCGRVVARQLLQHFGGVKRILNATEDELRTVRGIGAKTAREMVKVLNAEYGALDTEQDLEDAIEAAPELLFAEPVTLVERQHYIFSDEGRRHFVDMVFLTPGGDELILVELKRGKLTREHYDQLRRYMDRASRSKRLRGYLEKGAQLRGILAAVEECTFECKDGDVEVRLVDKKHAIEVLACLREMRLARMAEELGAARR